MNQSVKSRRSFIKSAALAGLAAAAGGQLKAASALLPVSKDKGLVFLFQGDSITDGNRGRNADPNHILGHGYAFSIASRLGASFPEKQNTFLNRGISGNKVTDLAARWQKDVIDLRPDILSILIGVNDTGSVINQKDIVNVQRYEETYRSLLVQTKDQLPDCLVVLCEPFILPSIKLKDNWDAWSDDLLKRQQTVKRLAMEFDAVFVPLQSVFSGAPAVRENYWIWDGIHPTYSGHALITKAWLQEVGRHLHFLKRTRF